MTASAKRLWFSAFGAAAAWSFDLLAVVSAGSAYCLAPAARLRPYGPAWVLLVAITGVAWLGAGVALVSTVRAGRAPAHDTPSRRARFMAFGGTLLNVMFVVGLLFSTVALFLAPLCY